MIRPGGKEHIGTLTTSSLELGFGARVVFDVKDGNIDKVVATKMSIEKKTWENGPQYSAPVFEFASVPEPGTYTLAEVGELTGNLSDVTVEGLAGKKFSLSYADGKIALTVSASRDSESSTWTGVNGSIWDLMNTENFSSSDKHFVTGDDVIFDDNASTTSVQLDEVTPGSVVFKNNSKTYNLSGNGVIEGDISLSVLGKGTVNITNTNKYSAGTYINGGTLVPSTLANNDGLQYGALGGAGNGINLLNEGTLKTTASMTASHPIILGENGGYLNTTGTLILNGGIKKSNAGSNRYLYKTGTGTLQLNCTADYDALYINQGTVYIAATRIM